MKPQLKYISPLLFGGLMVGFFISLNFKKILPADEPVHTCCSSFTIQQKVIGAVFPVYNKVCTDVPRRQKN